MTQTEITHYDKRYNGSNKQAPSATAIPIKERSLMTSRTRESLMEVTFQLRLTNESDDKGMGRGF